MTPSDTAGDVLAQKLAVHLRNALDWIDAVPNDVVASLPAMPGFDRDDVENDLTACRSRPAPAGKAVAWMRMNSQGTASTGVTDTTFYRDLWIKEGSDVRSLYTSIPAPSSGQVEKIARLLCKQAGFDPDGAPRVGYGWRNYEKNAREILAALSATHPLSGR